MKGSSTFLQGVVVLVGVGTLTLLLWEPRIEGVNAHATNLYQVYFDDPFLAMVYLGSIPFFVALYQVFKVLGYVGKNQVFSQEAMKALRTIKYCALAIIGFVVAAEVFILLVNNGDNDNPGAPIFIGALITFGSIVIVTAAAMFEGILQNAVGMKSGKRLKLNCSCPNSGRDRRGV